MDKYENSIQLALTHDLLFNNKKESHLMIEGGKGIHCIDNYGNKYLNLNEISFPLGYNHEKFTKKIENAFGTKMMGHIGDISEEKSTLIERLSKSTNDKFSKIFVASSGGEIIDLAIKTAKRYTNKHEILSYWKSLHGRSFAGAALSGINNRKSNFGPVIPGIIFTPYPDCKNCHFCTDKKNCDFYCIEFMKKNIEYTSTNDLAAIIIEPFQPMDGMVYPSKEYFKKLRQFADEKNALIILDEIQSGFGRTGTMYAYEQLDIDADILCLGKGMSNGFGLGALLVKKEIGCTLKSYELGGGSADNDFNCYVINTVMDIFEEENILDNVKIQGEIFRDKLTELQKEVDCINDVKCFGLAIGIELNKIEVQNVVDECFRRKILVGSSMKNLLIRPSLVINKQESEFAVDTIIDVIKNLRN